MQFIFIIKMHATKQTKLRFHTVVQTSIIKTDNFTCQLSAQQQSYIRIVDGNPINQLL
jgi:hypothetical protein